MATAKTTFVFTINWNKFIRTTLYFIVYKRGSEGVECVVVVGGAESFKHYAAAAGVRSHKYFSVIFALSFALILAFFLAIC